MLTYSHSSVQLMQKNYLFQFRQVYYCWLVTLDTNSDLLGNIPVLVKPNGPPCSTTSADFLYNNNYGQKKSLPDKKCKFVPKKLLPKLTFMVILMTTGSK